jgi:prolyl 4-hydroxylase
VGLPQDLTRGRELFQRSAQLGHPMGTRAWTNLLATGIGGERNWQEALRRLDYEGQSDLLRRRMRDVIQQMQLTSSGDPVTVPDPERLRDDPETLLFRNAFTVAECDFLMLLAEPTYEPSLVIMGGRNVPDPIRTSEGSTIHWLIEDPATHAINRRLAALSKTKFECGEPLHILRYRPGQEYRPHVDWLPPPNRRVLTALIYLNDDYTGGETSFVKTGLNVRGQKGDVLIFSSLGPDGNVHPLSEHAGLPVTSGTKYLGSRWIREAPYSAS